MAFPPRRSGGFPPPGSKITTRINEQIRVPQVRLIDADGAQLGIKSTAEALSIARAKSLDLVEVAPKGVPPVCKLLLYSKFKYEQDKKEREARKHQKAGLLKEVRFSPVIGQHDLDVKIKHAEEFLKENDKVRFTVVFRGRQNQHKDLGFQLLKSVAERLNELAAIEQQPVTDKNRLSMTLAPRR
ncbi:MAG: translation initiation factor IF-3 [Elusimicrobia bacterium]|nr:translation initiation factor IF-3 [Elusimicrobiota bacterium]MBI5595183.1 translation initiation factor IF-3 [Elusimicrobiota bacterium]